MPVFERGKDALPVGRFSYDGRKATNPLATNSLSESQYSQQRNRIEGMPVSWVRANFRCSVSSGKSKGANR